MVGIAVVTLATALVALCVVPLSNVTYVAGMITLQGERKSIQHAEGGVVAAVLVEEGQEVQAGQRLVTLDGERLRSASLNARAQYCALRLEASRLTRAANLSAAALAGAGDDATCASGGFSEINQHESLAKATAYETHVFALGLLQSSLRAELGQLERHRSLSSAASENDEVELGMHTGLQKAGWGSKLTSIAAKRQLFASQSLGLELDLRQKELQDRLAQSVADLADFKASYASATIADVERATSALSEAQARMRVLDDQEAHLSITSPVRGHVLGLTVHSVGSVVLAGAVIMEIVPVGPKMVIEGKARPGDFATLSVGQLIKATVTRATGRPLTLSAHLVDLSPDRMMDRADNSFFVFHAQFDADQDLPPGLLRAGLPVNLVITTGEHTPLEAFFGPVLVWLQDRK